MADHSGMTVVLTGATSGIGLETARLLTARGARVFGTARHAEAAEALRTTLGPRFTPLLLDVRDEPALHAAAATVREALAGRTLSALVNNVGIGIPGPVLHQPLADIREQIETNLISMFAATQAFAPLLGADRTLGGPPGRIVLMSSLGGLLSEPFAAAYTASKHGVEGFAKALRQELQLFGIEVITVAPSIVRTPAWDTVERQDRSPYWNTPFARPLARMVRSALDAGRSESALAPQAVAEIIHRALTAPRPSLRYAPAARPWLEQGVLPAIPRRLLDAAIGLRFGLRPSLSRRGRAARPLPSHGATRSRPVSS
jgi:NAD(P)-dependent dehydrogenase (short-subunit alcohol dehydrogenase family)